MEDALTPDFVRSGFIFNSLWNVAFLNSFRLVAGVVVVRCEPTRANVEPDGVDGLARLDEAGLATTVGFVSLLLNVCCRMISDALVCGG